MKNEIIAITAIIVVTIFAAGSILPSENSNAPSSHAPRIKDKYGTSTGAGRQ